jgi:hypothetical protein
MMKLAGEHTTGMNLGRTALPGLSIFVTRRNVLTLVIALLGAAGFVVFYSGAQSEIVQFALDVLSWCLIAALASAALLMCVKVIDGFLDA